MPSPVHKRDDYRSAARYALGAATAGERVLWVAAPVGAWYYRVPLQPLDALSGVLDGYNRTTEELTQAPLPDAVILTKPDLCDAAGAAQRQIASYRYQVVQAFPAFTIYRRNVE